MTREIIAILRGVEPGEVIGIAHTLLEVGITQIEVPLNSPEPLKSIEALVQVFSHDALIGAGTVLGVEQVNQVADVGGQLIVSPNMEPDVIRQSKQRGLISYPGVQTPTECFAALDSGADGLKFFPSMLLGPDGLKAISAVLPGATRTFAVGGAGPENFSDWIAAGVTGFGIGSFLYKPGDSQAQVKKNALLCVKAYDDAVALN